MPFLRESVDYIVMMKYIFLRETVDHVIPMRHALSLYMNGLIKELKTSSWKSIILDKIASNMDTLKTMGVVQDSKCKISNHPFLKLYGTIRSVGAYIHVWLPSNV